jgi:DNA-binding XRE family transcriptional regulator
MNLQLLQERIKDSGITKVALAKKLDITTQSLWDKLNGKYNFSLADAERLTDILHLSDSEAKEIFLKGENEIAL